MKYLVKVREIFEHTYLVEAESKETAEEIAIDNSDGCDLDNDYTGAEYEVRELGDEDQISMMSATRSEKGRYEYG